MPVVYRIATPPNAPFAQTMVQTRSTTKAIDPAHAHASPQKHVAFENRQGNGSPSAIQERRRQDGSSPLAKKRRRGKPGELCQLNLDVLFLIAEYIHPLDLLNLARTCKSLRVLLMDKSSAFVWRSARRQIKALPDCPADLTEPEYANLVFYARCHGCGKHTNAVYWQIRRRYCSNCRDDRLYDLFSCDEIILNNHVLALVQLTIERSTKIKVDKEQKDSFMEEYKSSSDKKQFIRDKQAQLTAIRRHASECENWQRHKAIEHQNDLKVRRQRRATSIFDRLKHHGYEPEINHFGQLEIQNTRRSLFRTSKPLSDKEWNRIWPEWVPTMDYLRSRRLECVVYRPRRLALASEYAMYVMNPSPSTPAFDLLPHPADLACFPPFRDIIRAPEGAHTNPVLFTSAIAQLPVLVDEWRKKLDAELAELVHIPPHLSLPTSSDTVSNKATAHTESPRPVTDKLRLACAVFYAGRDDVLAHPEVFLTSMRHHVYPRYGEDESERTGSICERYNIGFVQEAPYIIHACGLDPNVATVEDMGRQNAWLECLSCSNSRIGNWKDAVKHARQHKLLRVPLSEPPWRVVGDERMNTDQSAEPSIKNGSTPAWTRCLLCRPRVGNALLYPDTIGHLKHCHCIEESDIKRGLHWRPLDVYEECPAEQPQMTESTER